MKRVICLVAVLAFIICLFPGCGDKASPVEDFVYTIKNGEVYITGYIGTDREIVIPDEIEERPVTQIGEEAFYAYDLTYVAMPDSVTQIHESAFAACSCLTEVRFSKNLEIIHENAFSNCEALAEIELPSSLQRINEGAFEKSGLESVDLPEDLQYIGCDAFGDCEQLESLTIPDNVQLYLNVSSTGASMDGVTVYLTRFDSFVGGSTSKDQTYNGETTSTPFETLPTIIIVKEGSFAHQQLQPYDVYDVITFEVK